MSPRVFFATVTLLTAVLVGSLTAGYFIWQTREGQVDIGGAYALVDHTGASVTNETYEGTWQVVFFGYTFCPDICPTTLATVTAAMDDLGPLAEQVTPIFISIDPARDTPEQLAGYHEHFHPRFAMLTGTDAQVDAAAKRFRVYYAKAHSDDATEYLMDHSTITYVLNPDGRYVTHFGHDATPERIAEILRDRIQG